MKLKITYLPSEAREADLIYRFAKGICGGARTHESAAHPPFRCIYLTTKKAGNLCSNKDYT